ISSRWLFVARSQACGCGVVEACDPSKVEVRVRFPPPALTCLMGVQPKISLCPRPRVSSSATRVGSSWKRRARKERRTAKRALAKLRPRTRTSTIRALYRRYVMRRAFAFLLILAVLLQPGAPQARAAQSE